jgi:hypothetical protein
MEGPVGAQASSLRPDLWCLQSTAGDIRAIAISHPHYYSAKVEWATAPTAMERLITQKGTRSAPEVLCQL